MHSEQNVAIYIVFRTTIPLVAMATETTIRDVHLKGFVPFSQMASTFQQLCSTSQLLRVPSQQKAVCNSNTNTRYTREMNCNLSCLMDSTYIPSIQH